MTATTPTLRAIATAWSDTRLDGGVASGDVRPRVEIRLLGPSEVVVLDRVVHVGSRRQRALLAVLALEAGRVVSSGTLLELVWETDRPPPATATIQRLISRLRRTLATASSELEGSHLVISKRHPGWLLDVESDCVDALRFQTLTARARVRRAREEVEAAADDLAAALRLWRGAALVDVVESGLLTAQATRLEQARLDAVEDLAEVELESGRAAEALARLERHVEANRLRERGWGLLMVALYRLGQRTAALGAFQEVRTILGEERQCEPSPQLAEIERRILDHDPCLGAPRRPVRTAAPPQQSVGGRVSSSVPELGGDYSVVVENHTVQGRTVVEPLVVGVEKATDAASGSEALVHTGLQFEQSEQGDSG